MEDDDLSDDKLTAAAAHHINSCHAAVPVLSSTVESVSVAEYVVFEMERTWRRSGHALNMVKIDSDRENLPTIIMSCSDFVASPDVNFSGFFSHGCAHHTALRTKQHSTKVKLGFT
jgi:hypothetical protein